MGIKSVTFQLPNPSYVQHTPKRYRHTPLNTSGGLKASTYHELDTRQRILQMMNSAALVMLLV